VPDEIDRLTLPDYQRIGRYWAIHPPAHLLLRAFLSSGVRRGSPAPEKSSLAELIAMMGPGGVLSAERGGG
jgi:hypothetical protein